MPRKKSNMQDPYSENQYFHLRSDMIKQATLIIDLNPYVEAYDTYGPESIDYRKIRSDLVNDLGGLAGCQHFENILDAITKDLDESERELILASPAVDIIENNFIEILKNSLDSALDDYYEDGRDAQVKLSVAIDDNYDENLISIEITDSGDGFPPEFLRKVETSEDRQNYMYETQKSAKKKHHDRPEYFGGIGFGLRHFAASEQGLLLNEYGTSKMNETPKEAILNFSNGPDATGQIAGAKITFITSKVYQSKSEIIHESFDDKRTHGPSPTSVEARPSPAPSLSIDVNFDDEDSDEDDGYDYKSPGNR